MYQGSIFTLLEKNLIQLFQWFFSCFSMDTDNHLNANSSPTDRQKGQDAVCRYAQTWVLAGPHLPPLHVSNTCKDGPTGPQHCWASCTELVVKTTAASWKQAVPEQSLAADRSAEAVGTSRALRCRALSQRALHTSASAAHQHSTPQTPCSTGQLQSTARPRIPYPSNDVCLPSGTICCSAASPERQKCSIAANSLQQNREGLDCKDSNASSLILFSL